MSTHTELEKQFGEYQNESEAFAQGNRAAGKRARKALQNLKTLAHKRRKEITDKSNK